MDTLYDRPLTERMLRTMRASVPAAEHIEQLVNTHANGDHCNGNCCLPEAKIIASKACAEEMAHEDPASMAAMAKAARAGQLGDLGDFFLHCFGAFDFESVEQRLPGNL